MNERILAGAVARLRDRRGRKLSRAAKACFCDAKGELTLEGRQLLADLREQSVLFGSGIRRDGNNTIDPGRLLELEGRRQIVLRLINLLELDPLGVAQFREVDDA